jgi:hypothetical protein
MTTSSSSGTALRNGLLALASSSEASEIIIKECGQDGADLSKSLVIVPSQTAGRQLRERLIQLAAEQDQEKKGQKLFTATRSCERVVK